MKLSAFTASVGLMGILLSTPTSSTELNLNLPEMQLSGTADQSTLITGNIDEPAIGRQLFRSLRGKQPVIEDPEIRHWLLKLAERLTRQLPGLNNNLHLAIVNNPEINAYALTGGIIVVNSGLILNTDNESELAAVLAHEIAHVSQRHIQRMQASTKLNPLLTGVGILAGIAVASKSPDAANAIFTGTAALQAQNQISYSQQFETEADRTGLRILTGSGMDPQGMASFLEKLARTESSAFGNLSKYLRSHPLTIERLSDTRSQIARLGNRSIADSSDYLYAREKLRVLYDRQNSQPKQALSPAMQNYQQALQHMKRGNYPAIPTLLNGQLNTLPAALAVADSYTQTNRPAEAIRLLQPFRQRYPQQEALLISLAKAHLRHGQPTQAWSLISPVRISDSTSLAFLELAQQVASQTQRPYDAIIYNAERNWRTGEYRLAKLSVQQALKSPALPAGVRGPLDNQLRQIIRAEEEMQYLKNL